MFSLDKLVVLCKYIYGNNIPLAKLQQLISSIAKHLRSVIKRKVDVTQTVVNMPRPIFFGECCSHQNQKLLYL